MSIAQEARRRRFHHYGPWILGGGAILVAIVVEAFRRHALTTNQILYFAVLIPSIVLHEVSHGAVANLCGDSTAKDAGRLTLNPLKHIDPIGTVLLPILLILTTGTSFGWAKPVPVSVNRLRHPRNQAVLVGLAGPAVNVLLALGFGLALRLDAPAGTIFQSGAILLPSGPSTFMEFLFLGGFANVVIAAFNLIPIPPLDGSSVVERFLPQSALAQYYRLRPLSMLIVLGFVFLAPGALDTLFNHAASIWERIVFS